MSDDGKPNERDEVIARAWSHLEQHEAEHPRQPYATALRLRRARPKASIASIAREISERVGSRFSAAELNKILYDARRRYQDVYETP